MEGCPTCGNNDFYGDGECRCCGYLDPVRSAEFAWWLRENEMEKDYELKSNTDKA